MKFSLDDFFDDLNGVVRQSANAFCLAEKKEDILCESIDSHEVAKTGSDAAISQPVSPAISLTSNRELLKTEITSNQSGGQCCNKSSQRSVNCYKCIHRGSIPGDAHSQCLHPKVLESPDRFLAPVLFVCGGSAGLVKRMNISGDDHGIKNGWFLWPLNYDPVWLKSCSGYSEITGDSK